MARIAYITYTEPANLCSGNEVRFFVREFDTKKKQGRSHLFVKEVEHIVPTVKNLEKELGKDIDSVLKDLDQQFQKYEISFKKKPYGDNWKKSLIWAIVNDRALLSARKKEKKISLPNYFLKTPYSQQLRFYYPPFTLVRLNNRDIELPTKLEKSTVDLELILQDKKCALDIETVDYDTEDERITNVTLNFGNNKYIITTFKPQFKEFKGYQIMGGCKDTDEIKLKTNDIIQQEDPLIFFGYNIQFDQKKLRELGKKDYLPGVAETHPVFKSVKGLLNMITKGRFTIDLYGYLYMFFSIYENNRLETQARMAGIPFSKSLSYDLLAYKTKKGEQGSEQDMIDVLNYNVEDGDVTFELGEKNERKILSKSLFVKRAPSTICTTSGKNIMKEFWKKKFFLRMNTLRDRYEYGYKKDEFILENYKDELLDLNDLKRKNGLFKEISIVYPLLFIKSFWPMIEGTTDNLRFRKSEERFDSYQTLNEYICNPMKDFLKFEKEKDTSLVSYRFRKEYAIDMREVSRRLKENSEKFKEILSKCGLVNYSKKFLYVKDASEIIKENLGFVFGKGNCLSADKKIISLLGDKLIYQGLGLSRGKKTEFDSNLMREFLLRRLSLEDELSIIKFVEREVDNLNQGKVPKERLLIKDIGKRLCGGESYGIINGSIIPIEKFLASDYKADVGWYVKNFLRVFGDVIYTSFEKRESRERLEAAFRNQS